MRRQHADSPGKGFVWSGSLLAALVLLSAAPPRARDLTFEERVEAQRAIERFYHSHQIGATRRFEDAVPRQVLEKKVRTYLKESVALERFWHTRVTGEMLRRELERIARQTGAPEKLPQLYAALGNDPLLIEECLARPVLVDRLTRNFFTTDSRIHGAALQQAEELRESVSRGIPGAGMDVPRPSILEVVRIDDGGAAPPPARERGLSRREGADGTVRVRPDEFARRRKLAPLRPGEVGRVTEERGAFRFQALLAEDEGRFKTATYTVEKIGWDAWWEGASPGFDGRAARTVASRADHLPRVGRRWGGGAPDWQAGAVTRTLRPAAPGPTCLPDDTWDNGILDDGPEGMAYHSAVWTGTEMIVLGRDSVPGSRRLGYRYDPLTDTWSAISMAGAPSDSLSATAIWTGSVVVLWGTDTTCPGGVCTRRSGGGRYDPVLDSWAPISTENSPQGGYDPKLVWTGRHVVLWGGTTCDAGGCHETNTGGRYDPVSDTWSPTSTTNAPSPRSSHSTVWAGGVMIVWGGTRCDAGGCHETNTGGRYDPSSDTWRPLSTMGAPAHNDRNTVVSTGTEMVIWPYTDLDNPDEELPGGRYNPTTDTWRTLSQANAPRGWSPFKGLWTGSSMLVWGGGACDEHGGGTSGGRYDPDTDTWDRISGLNAPGGCGLSAVWTGQAMVVWGGTGYNGEESFFNTGGRYDPASDTWTPTATRNAPFESSHNTAVWTGNQMLVWAREGGEGGGRYDPLLDSWSPISTVGSPSGYYGFTAVWAGDRMLVWGGAEARAGGRYDPIADSWTPISAASAPVGTRDSAALWTGNAMLLWNGRDGGRYDPVADVWSALSILDAPSPRAFFTAVWTGRQMVVWGGLDCDAIGCRRLDTGGRYDPALDRWSPTSTADAPLPRYDHTAVWADGVMVVWGGYQNTAGRYNPESDTWMPTTTTNAPPGRTGHTGVWTGRHMIVWGGIGIGLSGARYDPLTDTWAPTSTTNAPSGRYGHAAVWTGTHMIVLGGTIDREDTGFASLTTGGRYVDNLSPDEDRDGFTICGGDCDDADAYVHPGAVEACNGIDDDCNLTVDDGSTAAIACDDADECTLDVCQGGACVHPPAIDAVMTCSMSPDVLSTRSAGRSFSLTITLEDRCSGRALDPALLGPVHLAQLTSPGVGAIVMPDPDYGPGCTQDGIWETLRARRRLAGDGLSINFIAPSDGFCATLDGNRQDLLALLTGAPDGDVVQVTFSGLYPGGLDPVTCVAQTKIQRSLSR